MGWFLPFLHDFCMDFHTDSRVDCFTLLLARHLADVSCYTGPSMPSGICMETHSLKEFSWHRKPGIKRYVYGTPNAISKV